MFVFVFLLRRIHFLLQKLFKSFQFNISYYYKLHYTFFPPSFPSVLTVLSSLLIWFVTKERANKNRKLYFTGLERNKFDNLLSTHQIEQTFTIISSFFSV